jgi:hypothetical protein
VDDGLRPALTGVVLLSPNLIHYRAVPDLYKPYYKSFGEFENELILDKKAIDYFDGESHLYAPRGWRRLKGLTRGYDT